MSFGIGYRLSVLALSIGAAMALPVGDARAQIGNAPIFSGGVGLSQGARQAILDARINNSRPRNLQRSADGGLIDVARNGNQALLQSRSTGNFATATRGGAGWASGLGTGLGWGFIGGGGVSYIGAYSAGRGEGPAESLRQWISMIMPSWGRAYADAGLSTGGGRTPIDDWIGGTE